MSRKEGCSCSSWGSQQQSVSSPSGWNRGLGERPMCYCGEVAVLRVAKTIRNAGKEFWGYPNFKVCTLILISFWFILQWWIVIGGCVFLFCKQRSGGNDVFKRCNYFKWLNKDNGDEKDATIARQRRKIYHLEKSLVISGKWVRFLSGIIICLGLINVILVWKFIQIPRSAVKFSSVVNRKLCNWSVFCSLLL